MKASTPTSTGLLVVFAAPFCLAGAWAGFETLRHISRGPIEPRQVFLQSVAALAFTGAGAGLIFFAKYTARKAREAEQLRRRHPAQPWMWQPDWAGGRISGSSKNTMVVSWVFAVVWNLISAPLLVVLPEEVLDKGNHAALIGLLFPVAGIAMLIWAVRATARWRKFGPSVFEMAAVPGVIGGPLGGSIQSGLPSAPPSGFRLSLTSVRRTRTSGRNSSTHERILWQEEQSVGPERLRTEHRGISVPVQFRIPPDCEQSDSKEPNNQVIWRLQAHADVAGIDYQTQFEVPVFWTDESSKTSSGEERQSYGALSNGAPARPFDPAEATVVVRPSMLGGSEYVFGPARNLGAAISTTVFLAIWLGALWLQLSWEVPLIFPIATGIVGVFLVFIVLGLWFGASRVVIESGRVRTIHTLFGLGRTKELPCSEISDVRSKIGMQQRQTATQAARAYYDIEFHRRNGRKLTVGRHLSNKREAEWLASEMKRLIEAYR